MQKISLSTTLEQAILNQPQKLINLDQPLKNNNILFFMDELFPNCYLLDHGSMMQFCNIQDDIVKNLTPRLKMYDLNEFISQNLDHYKQAAQLFSKEIENDSFFEIFPFWESKKYPWQNEEAITHKSFLVKQSIFDIYNLVGHYNIKCDLCFDKKNQLYLLINLDDGKLIHLKIHDSAYQVDFYVEKKLFTSAKSSSETTAALIALKHSLSIPTNAT